MPPQFRDQNQTELIQIVSGISPSGSLQIEPIIMERNLAAPPMSRPIGTLQIDLSRLIQEILTIVAGGRLLNQSMPAIIDSMRKRLCGDDKILPDSTPDSVLQSIVVVLVEEIIKLSISGE